MQQVLSTKTRLVLFMWALLAAGWYFNALVAEDAKPIPTETIQESVRGTMRDKLTHSQKILHGLVTSDFKMINTAAKELKNVSLNAPEEIEGDETDNELYNHFRLEFLRITTHLEKMSAEKNLEGVAFAYQNMTANCLACHSYLDQQPDQTLKDVK